MWLQLPSHPEPHGRPCLTVDGHTYERSAIEEWLADHDTSPMTGLTLESKVLIPNNALRQVSE